MTPWTAAHQAPLSFTTSWSLLKFMSSESVMLSNHLILCYPLLLLPSIFPSIRLFSNESALHIRWPKYWSFSISPSNEYSGLISFRIDWFDLLAVQGALKSLLQHRSSNASTLQCSAFLMAQFSCPYMTTEKTIALPLQTFVGKVMSLLFSMLSRFVIAFLPRSKHFSLSWLQSLSAVILEPKETSYLFKCNLHIPLQYSCLENPMDGGAWWAAVHGVSKSGTRLSTFTFTFHFRALKKEMATHSSVLAWRIPGMAEPFGLPSMGSHRVGHD